ncbi:hypothetical protein NDU88_008313 [Pleurodeles waltl]|uniref:Uncharacterized protein n=1 Tax=Pleurodeles waltl TaxID=8319 RepID=A0AAV7QS67_PLEWA|nr:hypothetical protein NDU88_008313 [Pleurodeles waltl]
MVVLHTRKEEESKEQKWPLNYWLQNRTMQEWATDRSSTNLILPTVRCMYETTRDIPTNRLSKPIQVAILLLKQESSASTHYESGLLRL